ncbi:MAG: arginine N-succinyltransferase [Pseudomonadota bacterium]|nr:arginine N-succinyltransferase [Pseudomonadota bacterium]MDE3037768.1 arginine N-succinyltransferase [Pseudomonadota bacterium]
MLLVRPVTIADHKEMLALAREAGIGMTSLPPDPEVLEQKIARSVASFAGKPEAAKEESFLFVLEDTGAKKLAGTCGLVAHVGLSRPFYSYKLSTIVQASPGLKVYSHQRVLHMVNDYTGATEIGSLFLLPAYRRDGIGKFLSRCRYLMLAEFPQLFSDVVISEIRGVQDMGGQSPFYKNLAQHFFQMDFKRADFVNATQGGQFISDLMPKYPIYVNLLDARAQAVIGEAHEASKPAVQMLEAEGFRHQGYIDVFDAGPTLQAGRADIRTVRESRRDSLSAIKDVKDAPLYMIASTALPQYRMALAPLEDNGTGVALSQETAAALQLKKGDTVRYIQA